MSKLSIEDKIEIYNKKKIGISRIAIANEYKIKEANVQYLVRLIDKHGYDVLRKNKNRKYTSYEKRKYY